MKKEFRVDCVIDKHDGKGKVEYPLYIKEAEDETEAERMAKYYVIDTMRASLFSAVANQI